MKPTFSKKGDSFRSTFVWMYWIVRKPLLIFRQNSNDKSHWNEPLTSREPHVFFYLPFLLFLAPFLCYSLFLSNTIIIILTSCTHLHLSHKLRARLEYIAAGLHCQASRSRLLMEISRCEKRQEQCDVSKCCFTAKSALLSAPVVQRDKIVNEGLPYLRLALSTTV